MTKSTSKGMPTLSVELAGERHNLRYDIESMMEVEQLMQALGIGKPDFFQLLDSPYNVREIVLMVQAGINGYHRYAEDKQTISTDEVRAIVQSHFDSIQKKVKSIPEWHAEQKKVHDAISKAARLGVGLAPVDEVTDQPLPNPKETPGATKGPSKPE